MPKHKIKTKELKHDPFREWYEKQAEWFRRHQSQVRRGGLMAGALIVILIVVTLGYSYWAEVAERHLAYAFDVFNAQVGDAPPTSPYERIYKTREEKDRAALEAFQQVSRSWLFRLSDYHQTALYHEALCQLQVNPEEGAKTLEQLSQGDSTSSRLARLALAQHLIGEGNAARAEMLYRELIQDPGLLPPFELQLGLAQTLTLQGKKDEAVTLYIEIAKERAQETEGREAIARLADLDPTALDRVPQAPAPTAPPDPLSRYTKK